MARQPAFHLFRFPIHIRPGFIIFMVLVIAVNGGDLGVWIAGSAAVLTLLHELGHAFAARATGAEAEISLDFLAGYASFTPVRRLSGWEQAGISVAGPAVQIGVGITALMLIGVNPIDPDSFTSNAAALAIWWTGPIMGLFNLVPVLPLDGGHIVLAGLGAIAPTNAKRLMLWFSVLLTGAGGIFLFTHPRFEGFAFVVIFPLLVQLQMLFGDRVDAAGHTDLRRPQRSPARNSARLDARATWQSSMRTQAASGEATAWETGDVSAIPEGLVPSPWYRASQQLHQGHPDVARHVLVSDFAESGVPNWWPPDLAPPAQLAALVALLPRPLPTGRVHSEQVLSTILLRLRDYDDAAHYAAASFDRSPNTTMAIIVARAAAALDDRETALGWIAAATRTATGTTNPEPALQPATRVGTATNSEAATRTPIPATAIAHPAVAALAMSLDEAPEFAGLRADQRFSATRARLGT